MKSKTNDELAALLELPQVDRTAINEASCRLKSFGLEKLLMATDILDSVSSSPLIDNHVVGIISPLVMAAAIRKQPTGRLPSLAGRILRGEEYTHQDVLSLASSVLSIDSEDCARQDDTNT